MNKNRFDNYIGDPKLFYKWNLNTLILKMVYPQVFSKFVLKFKDDIKVAKHHLKNIGKNSAIRVIEDFPIKEFNIKILIRKLTYRHWGTKCKILGKIKDGELRIIIKKCPLCEGLEPLEVEGLHYCTSTAGFLEGAIEVLQKKYDNLNQSKFTFDTIESVGSNDPRCIHLCKIE